MASLSAQSPGWMDKQISLKASKLESLKLTGYELFNCRTVVAPIITEVTNG